MLINQLKIHIKDLCEINRSGKVNNEEMTKIIKKLKKSYDIDPNDISSLTFLKKSLDARRGHELSYIYNLEVTLKSDNYPDKKREEFIPYKDNNKKYSTDKKIIITGAGPAGLFCAYILALNGFAPLVIEQGDPIEKRVQKVEQFWRDNNVLDIHSNVSFGEGGAGTFSDGKLNTSVKDKTGRLAYIKKVFVENGAPEEILYLDKPHIGTDKLREVIVSIRNKIIKMGGQVYFNKCLTDISVINKYADARIAYKSITGISIIDTQTDVKTDFSCDCLVLAIGHSSRKTYRMLKEKDVPMSAKDFAVGVRVVHKREFIDKCQYGREHYKLPAADYKLRYHTKNDRAVYSFCMCPGGYVVNSSSDNGITVVNGMSDHDRAGDYSNSAIVVNVSSGSDYDGNADVLAGMYYQEKLESAAYKLANGKIPVQMYGDYKNNCISDLSLLTCEGSNTSDAVINIENAIKGEYKPANLRAALPDCINESIIEAMDHYDGVMKGFGNDGTLLCGVETRTSAPVRITRDESMQSEIKGIYPCGEGAGYAGGIMSACSDGIKCALAIMDSLII